MSTAWESENGIASLGPGWEPKAMGTELSANMRQRQNSHGLKSFSFDVTKEPANSITDNSIVDNLKIVKYTQHFTHIQNQFLNVSLQEK